MNESSATPSTATRVNISADRRRPVARTKHEYDLPSGVALNEDVWPLVGRDMGAPREHTR